MARASRWQGPAPTYLRMILPGQGLKGGYNFTNPWLRAQVLNATQAYAFTQPQLAAQRSLFGNSRGASYNAFAQDYPTTIADLTAVGQANAQNFGAAYAALMSGSAANWAAWNSAQSAATQSNQGSGGGLFGGLF